VLVEVGNVVDFHGQPAVRALDDVAGRLFKRAEPTREGKLLVVADRLIAEPQHGIPVHRRLDLGGEAGGQRLAQVDAGRLAEEFRMVAGVCRPDGEAHGHFLVRSLPSR
jgi:hypothetical protein